MQIPTDIRSIQPIVLCGGSGDRLWPRSTAHEPKQFVELVGGRTLLQATLQRIAACSGTGTPTLVGSSDHEMRLWAAAEQVGARLLLEPVRRNTATAIALAACLAARDDPAAILWIVPADHYGGDPRPLSEALGVAAEAAMQGRIVTFGLKPTRAAVEYGWISPGAGAAVAGGLAIERFIEKPDAGEAERLFRDGRYLWNSGMFVARADVLLAEFARLAPAIESAARAALPDGKTSGRKVAASIDPLRAIPSVQFDRAVMERTDLGVVVPLDWDWDDLGSWDAVWRRGAKDPSGNAAVGDTELIDSSNCLVHGSGRPVAVIGMRDTAVVATDAGVLVTTRALAQRVKDLEVRSRPMQIPVAPGSVVTRPWGSWRVVDRGENFQVKHLVVSVGAGLSRQYHHLRTEHWTVVAGRARIDLDGHEHVLEANRSIMIPRRAVHRLTNCGVDELHVVEIQFGEYLGEDDIVRLPEKR